MPKDNIPRDLGKKIELGSNPCGICGKVHKIWGYDKLRKYDGKLVKYSNHLCPKLKDFDAWGPLRRDI